MILALLCLLILTSPALSSHSGEVLPTLSGETLSGKSVELPRAALGKAAAVIIFSFSESAGADAQAWREHTHREQSLHDNGQCFTVIMLQPVPRLLRPLVRSRIKDSVPGDAQDTTVLVYKEEAFWKKFLGAGNEGRAYVLLLNKDGRVRWRNAGPFSEAEFQTMMGHRS